MTAPMTTIHSQQINLLLHEVCILLSDRMSFRKLLFFHDFHDVGCNKSHDCNKKMCDLNLPNHKLPAVGTVMGSKKVMSLGHVLMWYMINEGKCTQQSKVLL